MNHYPRDKGILSALDYLGVSVDPVPMLRRVKRAGKPIAKRSTSRWLALCWFVSLVLWKD
jgi:hypothetical protein